MDQPVTVEAGGRVTPRLVDAMVRVYAEMRRKSSTGIVTSADLIAHGFDASAVGDVWPRVYQRGEALVEAKEKALEADR